MTASGSEPEARVETDRTMIQIGEVWREALAFLRILSILCISLIRLLRGLLELLGILLLVGLLVLSRKVSEFLAELLIFLRA